MECTIEAPWSTDETDFFFPSPEQSPLVTLYDGIGTLIAGRPTVIAALGVAERTFLGSWFVYSTKDPLSWVKPKVVIDKTLLQCVGKQLFFCTLEGVEVLEPSVRPSV